MSLFEDTPLPGAPYLVAAFLALWGFLHCFELPPEPIAEISYQKYHCNDESNFSSDEGFGFGVVEWLGGSRRKPYREEAVFLLSNVEIAEEFESRL